MDTWNFWVVGGDARQVTLARSLREDGHTVHTYALERSGDPPCPANDLSGIGEAQCVVLPLPAVKGGRLNTPLSELALTAEQVLGALSPGTLVCGGRMDEALMAQGRALGLRMADYYAREELAVANAVPTGEGTIQIAMEELPVTLHGAKALILGAGRLGKVLAQQLQGLGVKVTVAARKWSDLAWIETWGCESVRSDDIHGHLGEYDLICNTVPTLLLDRPALSELKGGCLVIDLASAPGGVDFAAAQELGVKVIWALALPGKAAPVTAGRIVRDTIYHILTEEGI